jgi:hypothetical protein
VKPETADPPGGPMPLDLNDTDKAALAELLRQLLARHPLPQSPQMRKLRAILIKLEAPKYRPELRHRSW